MLSFAPLNHMSKQIIPFMTGRTYLEKAHRSAHVVVSYNLPTQAKKTALFTLL